MADRDNILKLVGQLTLYPDAHIQSLWVNVNDEPQTREQVICGVTKGSSCGTAGCAAGWASILFSPAGTIYSPNNSSALYLPDPSGPFTVDGYEIIRVTDSYEYVPREKRLRRESVESFAITALDLTYEQASWMFSPFRTVPELIAGFREILAKPDISSYSLSIKCGGLE